MALYEQNTLIQVQQLKLKCLKNKPGVATIKYMLNHPLLYTTTIDTIDRKYNSQMQYRLQVYVFWLTHLYKLLTDDLNS